MTPQRIDIDPAIMLGKPVIRGTRITVGLILRKLAEGASETELLEDYPHLTNEDIRIEKPPVQVSICHGRNVVLMQERGANQREREKEESP